MKILANCRTIPFYHTATRWFCCVLVITALPGFAMQSVAQEGPKGIAFVEAPEQGSGVCHGSTAEAAFACARKQCAEESEYDEECLDIRWCFPAGWSADIFKQHREGPHWHHLLCGWDSEADLDAAVKIACEGSAAEYLIECALVAKWSPDGERFEAQ